MLRLVLLVSFLIVAGSAFPQSIYSPNRLQISPESVTWKMRLPATDRGIPDWAKSFAQAAYKNYLIEHGKPLPDKKPHPDTMKIGTSPFPIEKIHPHEIFRPDGLPGHPVPPIQASDDPSSKDGMRLRH